jgi:hypothetical protein
MESLFVCSHIGDYCVCGQPADALCDAPRPWWQSPVIQELHKQAVTLAAAYRAASPREQQLIQREIDGINARMRHLSTDGPPEIRTCSAPICDACALLIGEDEHLCAACAEPFLARQAKDAKKQTMLMARGPGVLPADGWIVWGKVAHHLRKPDDVVAACKRLVRPGWRPARDERRCKGCAQ